MFLPWPVVSAANSKQPDAKVLVDIPVGMLRKGLYVNRLDRPWEGTPFLFQGFELDNDEDIASLRTLCKQVDSLLARPAELAEDAPHAEAAPAEGGPRPTGDPRVGGERPAAAAPLAEPALPEEGSRRGDLGANREGQNADDYSKYIKRQPCWAAGRP